MKVTFNTINHNLMIHIEGDIDHHTCESIRTKIDNEIMIKNPRSIVFDMSKVGFMDSSGVGVIIGRFKQITSKGGVTAMSNLSPQIKRIYEICGLKKIIPSYNDNETAVKSLK